VSDEQVLVDIIRSAVTRGTSNGAQLQYREGYIFGGSASSYYLSAYLDGDETTLVTGIIPIAGSYVGAGDYVQVVTNEFGFSWVNRVKETALYSKLATDVNRGMLFIGSGESAPSSGSSGYVLTSGGSSASSYWAPAAGGVTDHGALTGLGDNDHTQYQLTSAKDVANGYAGLDSGTKIPVAKLGSGAAGAGAKFLADDQTWIAVSSAAPTFIGARAIKASNQSLTTATEAAITFSSEVYDTDAFHSTSSNTSRFTIPTTGKYHIDAGVEFDGSTGGSRFAKLVLNGTTEIAFDRRGPNGGSITDTPNVHIDYSFTAGDYVELTALQTSGGNINARSGDETYLNIHALNGAQGPAGSTGAAGAGVPTGGTANQYLKKVTTTDFDTSWSTPAWAPDSVDYLVGTASAGLSAEIVVGTSPGGELGGTWASPTVDATHSGSAHHAQSHDHSAAGDSTALSPATLTLPVATTPAQTAEGSVVWDSDDDVLTVGTGAARKIFPYEGSTTPSAVSTSGSSGSGHESSLAGHVHPHEAAHVAHDTVWAAKGDLVVGTANDTAAILTVGANDTIPMADSTTGTGIKWVSPATPVAIGTANSESATDDFSRGGHVHAHETAHVAHDTVWDAKGDIVTGSGADTAVKTTVGADDTVLMADSAAGGGVKWVAPVTPVAIGTANAQGNSDDFTRGSHVHAHGSIAADASTTDLTGTLSANARIAVNKNSGATVGTRRRINLIEGSNVTLTVVDDNANEEVDITIAAAGSGGVADGDKGDITVSGSGATWTIDNDVVTYAKMQNISATDRLLGRDTAAAGDTEELTVGGGIEFTGSGGIQRSALTGDITATAGSGATTLAAGSASNLNSGTLPAGRLPALTGDVTTTIGTVATTIANDAVTYAKMQNVSATDRLLGRDTAAAGDVEEITVGGGLEFTGSTGIQRSALTGDVTASAGSNATTVAATHSGTSHAGVIATHEGLSDPHTGYVLESAIVASTYTPNWTGSTTNPVLNNGTITGKYIVVGKMCWVEVIITMGSSTTYGSGTWSVSVPVTSASDVGRQVLPQGTQRTSVTRPIYGELISNDTNVTLRSWPTTAGNAMTAVTPTFPTTWASTDVLTMSGWYRTA
jgi:hypothetical protein